MEELPREFLFLTRNLFLLLCINEKDATLSIRPESVSGNKQARLVKITSSKQSAEASHLRHATKALFELDTRTVHILRIKQDKKESLAHQQLAVCIIPPGRRRSIAPDGSTPHFHTWLQPAVTHPSSTPGTSKPLQ